MEMCRVCRLKRTVDEEGARNRREDGQEGEELVSSLPISSSGRSSESIPDHTPSDVTSEGVLTGYPPVCSFPLFFHRSFQPKRNNRYQSSGRAPKMQNGTHPRMSGAEKKISIRQRNGWESHFSYVFVRFQRPVSPVSNEPLLLPQPAPLWHLLTKQKTKHRVFIAVIL